MTTYQYEAPVLKALEESPMSCLDLMKHLGLDSHLPIHYALHSLHKKGKVYIFFWRRPEHKVGKLAAVYALGSQSDAVRPEPLASWGKLCKKKRENPEPKPETPWYSLMSVWK